jgi:hypothetical protein
MMTSTDWRIWSVGMSISLAVSVPNWKPFVKEWCGSDSSRDEDEAMLAAQMVGVHWTAMELLRQVGATGNRLQLNDAGSLAVKLLRTYTAQLEALKRYRSAGEQRVVVQHVTVTADQAAVQVNATPAPRGEGDGAKLEDQSHGQQLGHRPEPTMRCPDPVRDAVPVASGEGTEAVPDARRR